ncbi:hypothetical protein [Serratia marcescens]|uniref:hypothetical protein n=1 Tax=Serratia marcescens TaxID=615 RepID=UPI00117D8612|nr:hypothetical protein [Serratia marcescens]TSB26105.1 hypothetical protein FOT43_21760 [Serratia marcescens]TSB26336.1 hypothetical protein FOT43_21230 [Serratia marcescens]TXE38205.1 hypothetical protein FOT60_22810 [Serratia marcescens]TXE44656.1 hypothetical protein FOT60_12120 [Serratia marcescens]
MKKVTPFIRGLCFAVSVLSLTACDAVDRVSSLRNDPIMKVRHGMSREAVLQTVGMPAGEHALQAGGSCLDYTTFTRKSGAPVQHAILLDNQQQVADIYTQSRCQTFGIK